MTPLRELWQLELLGGVALSLVEKVYNTIYYILYTLYSILYTYTPLYTLIYAYILLYIIQVVRGMRAFAEAREDQVCIICIICIGVVCSICVVIQYMVYNCVYYCDTWYEGLRCGQRGPGTIAHALICTHIHAFI
jgi:hypothetical protein